MPVWLMPVCRQEPLVFLLIDEETPIHLRELDQMMWTETPPTDHRGVVLYAGDAHVAVHEQAVQTELAQRLARLQGLEFLGEYEPAFHSRGPLYFIPADTITGVEQANRLGIRHEQDLFGGVVPQPFVATKSITHSLIGPEARSIPGWSAEFGNSDGGYLASILTTLRPVKWLALSVPALYRDEEWSRPKRQLNREDLATYSSTSVPVG